MVERRVDYQSMECSAYLHPDRIKEPGYRFDRYYKAKETRVVAWLIVSVRPKTF